MKRSWIPVLLIGLLAAWPSEAGKPRRGGKDPGGATNASSSRKPRPAVPDIKPAPPALDDERDTSGRPATAIAMIELLSKSFTAEQLAEGTYIGSEMCIACHQGTKGWRETAHANMHSGLTDDAYEMDPVRGIIFDINEDGTCDFKQDLDFNAVSSAFDPFKPNAPVLSFAAGEKNPYRVRIGTVTYAVVLRQGGFYQQRLMTRAPVTDGVDGQSYGLYMLPFAYSPRYKTMALYNANNWWVYNGTTPTNQPRITGALPGATVEGFLTSWYKRCVGCHATGYELVTAPNGETEARLPPQVLYEVGDPRYVDLKGCGTPVFVNVGCESCHGKGSNHVLGGGDPSKIINPKSLDALAQNNLCGQCHSRGASVPSEKHGFPYDEVNQKPYPIGGDLSLYLKDKPGLWPDGKTPARGEQQWQAQKQSLHWSSMPWQKVLCTECHNPHNGERKNPIRVLEHGGRIFNTSWDNNTNCLACHATHGPFADITPEMVQNYEANRAEIGEVVSAHSYHPSNPEGFFGVGRCTGCHMLKTGTRDYSYDMTSHTMEAIPPAKTLTYAGTSTGNPNGCQISCHGQRRWNGEPIQGDDNWKIWNEVGDQRTARILQHFFGPEGLWWNTGDAKSAAGRWLSAAPSAKEAERSVHPPIDGVDPQ